MDDVEVEVVDAPVLQLLLGDWLDTLLVVERIPKLGNDEELLTLDETILNGAGDTLTSLDLVSVVCELSERAESYTSAR